MSRVEGRCACEKWGCTVHYGAYAVDKDGHDVRLVLGSGTREGWVDSITSICRACEIETGDRWGHNTAKAEEPTPKAGERSI